MTQQFRWEKVPGWRDKYEVVPRGREDQVPAWTQEDLENLVRRVKRVAAAR